MSTSRRRRLVGFGLALVVAVGGGVWSWSRGAARPEIERGPDGNEPADGPAPTLRPDPLPRAMPSPPATAAPGSEGLAVGDPLDVVVRSSADGRPVVGADVVLRDDAGMVAIAGRTGVGGVARILVPAAAAWTLDVQADGHVRRRVHLGPAAESTPSPRAVDVALDRGTTVRGLVLESTSSRGVGGASIAVRRGGELDGVSSWSSEGVLVTSSTDRDGRFVVEGVPVGEIVSIVASARGFVAATRALTIGRVADEVPELRIHVEHSSAVVGRVVDATGWPADRAVVAAVEVPDVEPGAANADAEVDRLEAYLPLGPAAIREPTASCDANGAFVLEGLRPGRSYRVFAVRSDVIRSCVSERVVAPVAGARAPVGELRLRRTGSLVVVVTDPQGAVVPEARVRIDRWAGDELHAEPVGSGATRTLRFASLAPGTHAMRVSGPGFVATQAFGAVEPDVEREVRVVLLRGAPLEGVVVDDLGVPVVGASVSAAPVDDGDRGGSGGGASTDGAGRFRIDGLRAVSHELAVVATGHGRAEPVHATAPAAGLRLAIPRAATVRLQARRPEGIEAAAKLEVAVERLAGGGSSGSRAWGDGRIELARVSPEPMRVVVSAEGFAPLALEVRPRPGEVHDLGEIVLGEGAACVGRVVDAEGRGIAGARLRFALPMFADDVVATTDADGAFRVANVPVGEVTVRIEAAGHLGGRATLRIGHDASPVILTLASPHRVEGRLRGGAGVEWTGWSVVLALEAPAPLGVPASVAAALDAAGRFVIDVAAGTHRVEVRDAEGRVRSPEGSSWRVPGSGPLEVDVR